MLTVTPVKYEMLNASNARLALKIANSVVPDLIVTDWEMPEMNGIEFINALKKNDLTKDIPVIMATGIMMTSDDLNLALSSGAVDFIRKPIDKIELIARVRTVLELSDFIYEIKLQKEISPNQQQASQENEISALKIQLNDKEQELASSINYHIQNENKANDITEKLKSLKPFLNDQGQGVMRSLLVSLKQNESQISLLELENKFDDIHSRFYRKIESKNDAITKNDKILATFMVLGFMPAEIAIIIEKSANSVNVGFSRLRTKLNQGDNRSLRKFLKTLK